MAVPLNLAWSESGPYQLTVKSLAQSNTKGLPDLEYSEKRGLLGKDDPGRWGITEMRGWEVLSYI